MSDDPTPRDEAATPRREEAQTPAPLERAAVPPPGVPPTHRPLIERIGLACIAVVLAAMFGGVSAASWAGGEPFLAVMGGIGCLMTLWVGVQTLLRG